MTAAVAEDGLYQATLFLGKVVAGFIVRNGKVAECAPVLRRTLLTPDGRPSYYVMQRSVWLGPEER